MSAAAMAQRGFTLRVADAPEHHRPGAATALDEDIYYELGFGGLQLFLAAFTTKGSCERASNDQSEMAWTGTDCQWIETATTKCRPLDNLCEARPSSFSDNTKLCECYKEDECDRSGWWNREKTVGGKCKWGAGLCKPDSAGVSLKEMQVCPQECWDGKCVKGNKELQRNQLKDLVSPTMEATYKDRCVNRCSKPQKELEGKMRRCGEGAFYEGENSIDCSQC
eukprot:CAMPEP_0115728748 /NCGR_PEP_ID=MMETSP0272-20121206/83138_1 /TAXON_ID=71861 /ORGANISM="Scrippsiella trochoidea, Strain CCMP3099" /LENGTH=222 /DNA_ID=CAMNT_0003172381 /DNA_START=134 /DNA_END=800 /DNA_ORIENTATION=-